MRAMRRLVAVAAVLACLVNVQEVKANASLGYILHSDLYYLQAGVIHHSYLFKLNVNAQANDDWQVEIYGTVYNAVNPAYSGNVYLIDTISGFGPKPQFLWTFLAADSGPCHLPRSLNTGFANCYKIEFRTKTWNEAQQQYVETAYSNKFLKVPDNNGV